MPLSSRSKRQDKIRSDQIREQVLQLIIKMSGHILSDFPRTKKEVKKVMGGKVLELDMAF